MQPRPAIRLQPLILVLALLLPAGLTSQESTGEEDSAYFEEVAVEIVNVEVYVTDKDGNPVEGLSKDDFEVLEDGRPVELLNFYAVSKGRPTSLGDLVDDRPKDPLAAST
jgi:hypothetical protein